MDDIIGRWPEREKELWELSRLLGIEHQAVDNEKTCRNGPPLALCPVVVHGSFSSHGKELVADLLNSVQPDYPKAMVCCPSMCSLREFLNNMLGQAIKSSKQQLSSSVPHPFSSTDPKCDSWADFVRQIRIHLSGEEGKERSGKECVKFYVVLDRSELLGYGWIGNHQPGEVLQRCLALFDRWCLAFVWLRPYSKAELERLLFRRSLDGILWLAPLPGVGWDESQRTIAKKGFISKVVQSVGIGTHDIEEISRIIVALWPVYLECIKLSPLSDEAREMPMDEVLQARIAPYLEHALNNLYQVNVDLRTLPSLSGDLKNDLQEPVLAKFIFLAAYLASQNPRDSDERIFTHRRTGKKRKTKGSGGGLEIDSETRTSSDSDLERILSILSTLLSTPCAESHTGWKSSERANLAVNSIRLGQLERFSQSQLILRISGPAEISNPRYRCFVDKYLAERIASELDFPLSEYLG
eukprot:282457_1